MKRFFTVLRLKTLEDLNRIYNFQDTAILCEIFEERATLLQKLFKFNARKCNSASSFSGCIQRLKSKCCIALPIDAEIVRVFESILKAGYTCVNTQMAFDTDLLVNDRKTEKVIFEAPTDELKRFSSKIIKTDENNQYGQAMTKPLPYGCIKRKDKILSLDELPALLASVTLDDTIGHLLTVDIEFSDINSKTLLFNEIYLPIFEKNKKISP